MGERHHYPLRMLPLAMLAAVVMGDVPGMVNPGTPRGIPPSYDCAVRIHAWEFGKATLPQRGVSVDLSWCFALCVSARPPRMRVALQTASETHTLINRLVATHTHSS